MSVRGNPIVILYAEDDEEDRMLVEDAFAESRLANDLHFVTDGLPQGELDALSVRGHAAAPGEVQSIVQGLLDAAAGDGGSVAVIPEGPYCAPLTAETAAR